MFVAVGSGTNRVGYSLDGITWLASASGTALITTQGMGVTWNGTFWYVVGSGTNQVIFSQDGITWSASSAGNTALSSGQAIAARNFVQAPLASTIQRINNTNAENLMVAAGQGTNTLSKITTPVD